MYSFDTASGSEWTIGNGRVTREFWADRDMIGAPIVAEPFVWVRPPAVGERAVLRLKSDRFAEQVVSTSVVRRVRGLTPCPHGCENTPVDAPWYNHGGSCPVALLMGVAPKQ